MIITEEKLKRIIKKSMQEIFAAELMKLRALFMIPHISDEEQKEIYKKYKKPSHQYGNPLDLKA